MGWTGSGSDGHAYAYSGGSFKTIDVPGADRTEAWGINDDGLIVGWYGTGADVYAFALMHGKYISFSYPGARATFAYGVNASGEVVGGYTFDYVTFHGFVTGPITAADFH